MPTTAELQEEYLLLKQQLADINSQITAIVKSKNKKYTYSNQETTHSAETQSLLELRDLRKDIKEQMTAIENKFASVFVQLKN